MRKFFIAAALFAGCLYGQIGINPETGLLDLRGAAGPPGPEGPPGAGITTLNTLTGLTQTFAVGTTGVDLNIVSSGTAHTFHLPNASASARGALTSGDWSAFNEKYGSGSNASGLIGIIAAQASDAKSIIFRRFSAGQANAVTVWQTEASVDMSLIRASDGSFVQPATSDGCATWASGVLGSTGTACGAGGGGDVSAGGNNTFTGINDFSAGQIRLKIGTAFPTSTECDASTEVGKAYVRYGDPATIATLLYTCQQTGAATYAWKQSTYAHGATLPSTCVLGDIFYDTDGSTGNAWFGCSPSNSWNAFRQTAAQTTSTATGTTAATNVDAAIAELTSEKQPTNANLDALAALAATAGLVARTGPGAFAVRTHTGTANEITITNGDGSAGNPIYALAATFDISGKTSTKPAKTGTTLPATCSVGEFFFDTDATAGANIYGCTATNTWTVETGGGGGGSGDLTEVQAGTGITVTNGTGPIPIVAANVVVSNLRDFTMDRDDTNVNELDIIGGNCDISGISTTIPNVTVTQTGGTGRSFFFCQNVGGVPTLRVGHSGDVTISCSAGCSDAGTMTGYPDGVKQLGYWDSTPATWDATESAGDQRSVFTIPEQCVDSSTIDCSFDSATKSRTFAATAAMTTDSEVQNGSLVFCDGTGTASVQTCTISGFSAYTDGQVIIYKPEDTNTTTQTVDISSVGAKSVLKHDGTALAAGDLTADRYYPITYNGTAFLLPPAGGGGAVADTTLNTVSFVDDFVSGQTSGGSGINGLYGWEQAGSGAVFAQLDTTEANHPGVIRMTTGTTSTNEANLLMRRSSAIKHYYDLSNISWTAEFLFLPGDAANTRLSVGFAGTNNRIHAYANNGGNWTAEWCTTGCFSAGASMAVASSNAWTHIRFVSNGTTVTAAINGGSPVTLTGTEPAAGSVYAYFQVLTNEAAANTMDVDAFRFDRTIGNRY